jgi:hypothetical protein
MRALGIWCKFPMIGNVGGPGGMFGALLPLVKPQYATYANEKAARVYISLGSPSSTGMVGDGATQKVTGRLNYINNQVRQFDFWCTSSYGISLD